MDIRKERLVQLRRVVEEAPDDLLHMARIVDKCDCGTARCALGWAIVDPWFQSQGINEVILAEDYSEHCVEETVTGESMEPALAEFFGIDVWEVEDLFGLDLSTSTASHAVSKKEVLDNIDALLAGEDTQAYEAIWELDDVP